MSYRGTKHVARILALSAAVLGAAPLPAEMVSQDQQELMRLANAGDLDAAYELLPEHARTWRSMADDGDARAVKWILKEFWGRWHGGLMYVQHPWDQGVLLQDYMKYKRWQWENDPPEGVDTAQELSETQGMTPLQFAERRLVQEAAEHIQNKLFLARCHLRGLLPGSTPESGLVMLREEAEKENYSAWWRLAEELLSGHYIDKEEVEAFYWFKRCEEWRYNQNAGESYSWVHGASKLEQSILDRFSEEAKEEGMRRWVGLLRARLAGGGRNARPFLFRAVLQDGAELEWTSSEELRICAIAMVESKGRRPYVNKEARQAAGWLARYYTFEIEMPKLKKAAYYGCLARADFLMRDMDELHAKYLMEDIQEENFLPQGIWEEIKEMAGPEQIAITQRDWEGYHMIFAQETQENHEILAPLSSGKIFNNPPCSAEPPP